MISKLFPHQSYPVGIGFLAPFFLSLVPLFLQALNQSSQTTDVTERFDSEICKVAVGKLGDGRHVVFRAELGIDKV